MLRQKLVQLIQLTVFLIPIQGVSGSIFDNLEDIEWKHWQCIGTFKNHRGEVTENVIGSLDYSDNKGDKKYHFTKKDWSLRTFHHPNNRQPSSEFNGKCRQYRENGPMIIGTQIEGACPDDSNLMNFRFNKNDGDFIIIWENPVFEQSVTFKGSCF